MSDMDEVIAFVTQYLQAEHDEQVASYTEKNYSRYQKTQKSVESFFAPRVTQGFSRTAFESDLYFSQFAPKAEKLQPRPVFLVRRYGHAEHGDLYQAVLGGDHKGDDTYARALFVARQDGALKVVAIYALDDDEEDVVEWVRYRGLRLQHLGAVHEARRLSPPAEPLHLEDYGRDAD